MVNKAEEIGVKWVQPVLEFKEDSLGNTDSHTVFSSGFMLQNVVGFGFDKSVVLEKICSGIALGGIVKGLCHQGSHQFTTRNVFKGDSLEVSGPISTRVRGINTHFQNKDHHGVVNAQFEVTGHTHFACKYPAFVVKRSFTTVREFPITFDAMSFESFRKSTVPK
ncbi:hypothetical protein GOP47_0011105 [Adiantum capillus-veneris]|uniref:Uncharacterized protein n=1 Tax=Adiantum capillus-veneris TaxID=13818 RepID=A0A9D4UT92_ADICA|nr:hypothetical protein GOP47_0011105 [Adiantum capillus-veneris]